MQAPLFFRQNTAMVFGDAKRVLNEILAALRNRGSHLSGALSGPRTPAPGRRVTALAAQ